MKLRSNELPMLLSTCFNRRPNHEMRRTGAESRTPECSGAVRGDWTVLNGINLSGFWDEIGEKTDLMGGSWCLVSSRLAPVGFSFHWPQQMSLKSCSLAFCNMRNGRF
jgi:hypothetical protein